ncbi:MAG: hypothetical protein HOV94_05510 [Saccharothrix sp.]|nr:hypothetical protein [Saccharothrix sp.]
MACAFGVLASYGGNAAGSAYLGQVVGGPRRSHRFRDRLARNAESDGDGSGSGANTGTGVTGADGSDQSSDSGGCLAAFAALIVLAIVFSIACIVGLATENDCGKGIQDVWDAIAGGDDPQTDAPQMTQEQLTALAGSDGGPHFAQQLFETQVVLWQAFDQAFDYLVLVGLLPPDDLAMTSPLYGQFLALPVRAGWPLRPTTAPQTTYIFDPGAPVEDPPEVAVPFPTAADPSVFIESANGHPTGPGIALSLLWQIVRREQDSFNLDLDADRGFHHRCWTVADGHSVQEDPVPVVELGYGEV